jgi:hypothetical protein
VSALEHGVRRRWCAEISTINASVSPANASKNKKEKSIVDINFNPGI